VFSSKSFWTAIACCAIAAGCAGKRDAVPARVGGTVVSVYEEPLQGILMARDLTSRRANVPIWVEVRLVEPLPDGRGSLFAKVDDAEVLAGDRVDLEVGDGAMPAVPPEASLMNVYDAFRSVPGAPSAKPSARTVAAVGYRVRVEVEPPAESERAMFLVP
jgi:hypothetical protein